MAIYFFDKNQTLIKIAPDSATFEAIQTQELDDDSLLKDTLSVTVKGDEKLLDAEYMAVKSYTGNAQTFDMYRIVTDSTPDKTMTFTGMSLAPYELNGHILKDLRPSNQSVEYTLNRILDGTDWRLGYIDDGLPNVTTTFYYVSAKEALKELQSLVGCEFVFKVEISGQKITDKWIEIYKEMGNRTKKRFNYGTNALTVVRETNKADIYTALIGRGKGEEVSSGEDNESGQAGYGRKITFEDIEWSIAKGNPLNKPKGQYYLELPQATQVYGIKNIDGTMKARVGIVDFDDEEDKNRLINLTYQQLLVSSRPKVLFKTTVANVGATGIGDTVTIHRHDLNIHYQTRVRKIVRNKLNDNKTQVELGDAVVTPSTKQAKQNNATIKNLNQEIEKVKADVTISQTSADGKNTIFYGSAEPTRKRTGDTWYRPHPSIAGETQMLVWNGDAWELVIDTSDLTSVSRAVEDAAVQADEAVQAANDADVRANEAIEKAGANANLLTTHQNTLDTIKNTTIPNINSSISNAMAEAQSALSSASSAMDEAKKADGKIADYVTRNGLVSGTTVDSKIDTATGEISKKITTVESKIPTEIGGRNYFSLTNLNKIQPTNWVVRAYVYNLKLEPNTKYTLSSNLPDQNGDTSKTNIYFNGSGTSESGVWEGKSVTNTSDDNGNIYVAIPTGRPYTQDILDGKYWVQLEKGTIKTDWSPAPEDNYTQEEFSIFENTYKEDVKGINSTLTDLSNKKLDGTTYTTFYNNEYKKTAQGVTDTYAKVNKVIDANGNSTDAFAKAVYDKNATRQSADFQNVTKDLVKTATYTAGINGVTESIQSVRGDINNLGSRNYFIRKEENVNKNYGWANGNLSGENGSIASDLIEVKEGDTFSSNTLVSQVGFYNSNKTYLGSLQGNGGALSKISGGTYRNFTVPSGKNIYFMRVTFRNNIMSGIKLDELKVMLNKGNVALDWSPAPEEMLGQADFQVFKGTYEKNDQTIKNRLTAIDSGKSGSILYNTNLALSTAQGNTRSITSLNTKVDGLKIGGRNLISGTDDLTNIFGSGYGGSSIKYHKDYEVSDAEWGKTTKATRVVITKASGTSGVFTTARDFKMIFGKPYTLSFYVKNLGQNRIQFNLNGLMLNPDGTGSQSIYVNGGESGKFSATGYMRNNPEWNWFQILAMPYPGITSMDFAIAYLQIEEGNFATDWTPALSDQMGKAEFTLFKNEYEDTSSKILNRLTAIDSSAEGSVVTRLNQAIKTADENSNTISKVNNIVTIQDTRNDNQPPSWYRNNYPKATVQEFKLTTAIRDSNIPSTSDYGILSTTIVWNNTSGGTIQQVFTQNDKRYTRRGWTDDTGWSPWVKMTDQEDIKNFVSSTSTEYQTIKERSNLYERVIGSSTEAGMKQNISRIVMTDSAFQTEVVDRQNLLSAMASGTGMTDDPYFDKGNNGIVVYDNGKTGTISITRQSTSGTGMPAPVNKPYRLAIAHGTSSTTSPHRGGVVNKTMGWTGGTVVVKFTAQLPVGRSFSYHDNGLGTGYTHGWLTDNKGTGKWETYMYYYRFGTGTISSFGFLAVTGASSAFTWYLSEYDIINVNETSASKITQLSDNINLKVSKSDLISQINVQAGGVLITSGTNKLNVTPTTTYIENGTIKSAMIKSLDAGKITAGTLDASKATITNIDANNITANKTSFVQSAWNGINNTVSVNANGIRSANSNGDWTLYHSGAISFGGGSSQGIYLEYADGSRNGLAINNRGATNTEITLDLVSSARNTLNFGRRTDTNGYDFRIDHYQGTKVSFDGRGVQRYTFNVNSDTQSHAISILGHGATSGYNKGSGLSIGMETADGESKGSRFYFSSTSDLVWLGKNSYSDLKPLAVFDLQFRWGQNGRKSMKTVLEYLSRASGVDINNIPDVV